MSRRILGMQVALCAVILVVSLCPGSSIAGDCEQWAGKLVSVQGTVQVKKAAGTQWETAIVNETYCPGDTIRVMERSRADIALANQPVLRLDQNTTITLRGLKEKKTSIVELFKGAAHFFSRGPRSLEVNTAFVNAGVEGTEFLVRVEDNRALITMFEGKVLASNQAGALALSSGESAEAESGKAPVARLVARPRDAVQWTLYYPPALHYRPADFAGLPDADQAKIRSSLEAFAKGNLTGAFENLAGIPERAREARLYNYRAFLLLSVGRVDEASGDIQQSLSLAPGNGDALALQCVTAVAQNDKEKALGLGTQAVERDPKSAPARIALSYAQQAIFNLGGALASTEEAVRLGPENALAWARLAELRQSFGQLGQSLEAARKAVALNPDLSRTQTVLGFAHLTQVSTGAAREAFQKAIRQDQADPLPRLGLGLAMIRDGLLAEGRAELEIAASLDPGSALVRSYLGKAYYEEKRDKPAEEQYQMAGGLDPKDPTSFFYDAILKQTANRPVEALHDLQRSIELNDNRAVYRSRLLLDEDLAARSASLAGIYSDLGFQQLALVEGWKSVNTDPSNFSAHRFLADSYSVLPRHEIARVSEVLQYQLLQPINITPIQPRQAESNLFLVSGGGPANASFNEFNPLFNRDRVALQANGLYGEDSTLSGEVIASGIFRDASLSAGYYSYETDGFRPNDDVKDSIANAFFQIGLAPRTSLQVEYRYRDTEKGDVELRFFPDEYKPKQRVEDQYRTVRLGGSQTFTPGSVLLGNFMYQTADRSTHDTPDDPFLQMFDLQGEDTSGSGELQYLLDTEHVDVVGGAGYFDIESEDVLTMDLLIPIDPALPPMPIRDVSTVSKDTQHTNVYLYSNIRYPRSVTLTVGGSGDFYRAEPQEENQFNPKVGITWNPVSSTTLRAAYFRTLKRTMITNQTLEPTQVAGFNQFFDDTNGTDSWRWGVAADQALSADLHGGVEFARRDLEYAWVDKTGVESVPRKTDWEELSGRAYLFWTPARMLSLSAEYLYEHHERGTDQAMGAKELTTHRVPLGINFFHPLGLSAMVKVTYYDQEGSFERQGALGTFIDGEDSFWLCDAGLSYRLPRRYGIVSLGARNLFNQEFNYFDTDPANPSIQPARMLFMNVTLSF